MATFAVNSRPNQPEAPIQVVVTDFDISMSSMVWIAIKMVPALVIAGILSFAIGIVVWRFI